MAKKSLKRLSDIGESGITSYSDRFVPKELLIHALKGAFSEKENKLTSGPHLSIAEILKSMRYQSSLSEQDMNHLWSCEHCRNNWELFQITTRNSTNPLPADISSFLIKHDTPVAFPDGTIAFESCQFGLLEELREAQPNQYYEIINTMAKRLVQYLRLNVSNDPCDTIVIAAFGNVVKTIADHAASIMSTLNFNQIEVVSVTDFEHPRFLCERTTFLGAKCVCFSDVAHQGQLLKNMAKEAQNVFSSNVWIHQVAVIKQIDEADTDLFDHQGLWVESREKRYSYDEFKVLFPEREKELVLFEPEVSSSEPQQSSEEATSALISNYLLERGAISINKRLHDNNYLFFIDGYKVLPSKTFQPCLPTLAEPNPVVHAERYFYKKTTNALKKAIGDHVDDLCIAYLERRNKRSSKIAKRLADILFQLYGVVVPIVGVGWSTGAIQTVTQQQVRVLSKSKSILMVDGAFRTGDAMQSLYRSIARIVGPWIPINALTVVGTKNHLRILPDGADTGFSVYSILQFPLLPPIPRLSDCSKRVKESAKKMVSELPEQGHLSRIRNLLTRYIDTSEDGVPDLAIDLARKMIYSTFGKPPLTKIRKSLLTHLSNLEDDEQLFATEFASKLIHEILNHCEPSQLSEYNIQESLLSFFDELEGDEPEYAKNLGRSVFEEIPKDSPLTLLRDGLLKYHVPFDSDGDSFGENCQFEDALALYEHSEDGHATVQDNTTNKRKLDKVLVQLMARPQIVNWLNQSLSEKRLKSIHKAHAVLILAALGKFDWLQESTWVNASYKWLTSAKLKGRWWSFPLAFLLLTERCISESYSDYDHQKGIEILSSARKQLLLLAATVEPFYMSPQLTFDGFEKGMERYNVPMILIEVIDYCLSMLNSDCTE